MTLDQAKQKISEAIEAAERRREVEHFTDEKNIRELLFAIELTNIMLEHDHL